MCKTTLPSTSKAITMNRTCIGDHFRWQTGITPRSHALGDPIAFKPVVILPLLLFEWFTCDRPQVQDFHVLHEDIVADVSTQCTPLQSVSVQVVCKEGMARGVVGFQHGQQIGW